MSEDDDDDDDDDNFGSAVTTTTASGATTRIAEKHRKGEREIQRRVMDGRTDGRRDGWVVVIESSALVLVVGGVPSREVVVESLVWRLRSSLGSM